MQTERILDIFPGSADGHRLVFTVCQFPGQADRFVLRQETFSSDVGWFVQSRVTIEREQMEGLKAVLTSRHVGVPTARSIGDADAAAVILPFKPAVAG